MTKRLKEYAQPGFHFYLARELSNLIPSLQNDTKILDVGCGTGAWLNRLGDLGFNNLCGIDIDASKFAASKKKLLKRNIDWEDWNLNERFELITAIEVLEHLENIGFFLNSITRYLESNGYLLITTPNVHSLENRLCFLLFEQMPGFHDKGEPTHVYPLLIKAFTRLLPRYKLKIVKIWGYPATSNYRFPHFGNPRLLRYTSKLLKLSLPNNLYGDNLCLLIKNDQ